jgi:hypothetical protein
MLFFVGFCFSLGIVFTLTIALSRMSKRIKDLAQTIALLQFPEGYNKEKETEEAREEDTERNMGESAKKT